MAAMKTPGVYIVEKNAFPNSVVEVATAVPAFIGYTEKASNKGKSLRDMPWRITSLPEFSQFFGSAPISEFKIKDKPAENAGENEEHEEENEDAQVEVLDTAFSLKGEDYALEQTGQRYLLYLSMRLFFQNGGGACYIVSVGDYKSPISATRLRKGINLLLKEQEPTMIVIPETVRLETAAEAITVQQAALEHCGYKTKNRFAILDIWGGYRDRRSDCIEDFRSALGINYLHYAAAYYPWVRTTIVENADLNFRNVSNLGKLQELITGELGLPAETPEVDPQKDSAAVKAEKNKIRAQLDEIKNIATDWDESTEEKKEESQSQINSLAKSLYTLSPLYREVITEMRRQLNLLPPGAAMAGAYTMVDNTRGVWKAPANISLNSVVEPSVKITHDEQEDLNVTTQGKSINAIRTFIGEGVLVWGARTLDGNGLDWRYINVRRTMIMLEESIKLATKAYVFDPNVSSTWVTIRSMISNFLTGIWKRGGLAGATPADAFSVHVGLGETMTSEDILEGILKVTVLVAPTRPAEFIEITFQQKMQES